MSCISSFRRIFILPSVLWSLWFQKQTAESRSPFSTPRALSFVTVTVSGGSDYSVSGRLLPSSSINPRPFLLFTRPLPLSSPFVNFCRSFRPASLRFLRATAAAKVGEPPLHAPVHHPRTSITTNPGLGICATSGLAPPNRCHPGPLEPFRTTIVSFQVRL